MIIHTQLAEGYKVFEGVIPQEMIDHCSPEISKEGFYQWQGEKAYAFSHWVLTFLSKQGIQVQEESTLHTFNRITSEGMQWHVDSYGNPKGAGRVFVACYITPTTNGRGALKILPNSHLGEYQEFREKLLQSNDLYDEDRRTSKEVESLPSEVLLPVPERSIIICDEQMIHAVEVNKSQDMRIMVLQWAWIKQKEEENEAC